MASFIDKVKFADQSIFMKEVVLLKNMSELGAGTRGASLGFKAAELAALKMGKDTFNRYPIIEAKDYNKGLYDRIDTPFAKHIDAIHQSLKNAGELISDTIVSGKMPFIVSGDHSNAAATIYGIKRAFPQKRLGVIWIDAHGDLHSPFTSPSGNMHGMPLAISLGEDNVDKARNDVVERTKELWEELKNLGGIQPKIKAQDLVFFGVRDTESAEDYLMKKENIRNITVEEYRYKGAAEAIAEAEKILKDCDLIYISFDVDSMDCDIVSHGTGTPVEKGFTPDEVQEIMMHFIKEPRLVAFEMVEINPLLDEKKNLMAETSVRIFDRLVRKYEEG